MLHLPPRFSLVPYTTLFRSEVDICRGGGALQNGSRIRRGNWSHDALRRPGPTEFQDGRHVATHTLQAKEQRPQRRHTAKPDRKSTRLNSSHLGISYAVFCLK